MQIKQSFLSLLKNCYQIILQAMTKQLLLSYDEGGYYNYCDYIVTGETEEEIVRNVAEHNMKARGRTKKD
jgi:hypothetical protein